MEDEKKPESTPDSDAPSESTESPSRADSTDTGDRKTEKPKPKAAAAKVPPKRPPKKKGPSYEDVEDDACVTAVRERFGEALVSAQSFLGQTILTLSSASLFEAMEFLCETREFDYLIDVTALDYHGDEKRWCLVYQIYSYSSGQLLRVKSRLSEGDVPTSVTSIWKAADWLEREIYDMFGIEFSGHPDLRRILLPEDWHGFPLRKDYDIKLQDQSWIKNHLKIRKVPN